MYFSKSLMLLAALTTGSIARPQGQERRDYSSATPSATSTPSASSSSSGGNSDWTATPASGSYSTSGFGSSTANSGDASSVTYQGNVGSPWGSNIIEVSSSDASNYKHVMQLKGSNTDSWKVVFWNKYGPSGKMDGWYGHSALEFTLSAGETKYVAFDDDSQGGFGASSGGSLPTDSSGGYSCTWGEFDFSSNGNSGWSGFDVSAIMAQKAGDSVQGMKMCDALSGTCSSITTDAGTVNNAYTTAETDIGGIGGNISGDGAVRLAVEIDIVRLACI